MSEGPQFTRVRHELRRRRLTVARVEPLPAQMVRIVLSGEELDGFTSLGFDDHIKLFLPPSAGEQTPAMRDFTPRHFDAQANELWIDFFLHEAGPAAAWASQVTAGQTLEIGGPKGSAVISLAGVELHLLIGDETAIPAIGRRLEELPAGSHAIVVIEIGADSDRPALSSRAAIRTVWVTRAHGATPSAANLIAALHTLDFLPERCFAWVAAESQSARAIRRYLKDERALPGKWIKAAGYWQRGASSTHDKIADDE